MKRYRIWMAAAAMAVSLLAGCASSGRAPVSSETLYSSQLQSGASGEVSVAGVSSETVSTEMSSAASSVKATQSGSSYKAIPKGTKKPVSSRDTEKPKPSSSKSPSSTPSGAASSKSPESAEPTGITVTLSVDCKTAVAQGNETALAIAGDGVMLSGRKITLDKGASAYDALKKSGLVVGARSSALGQYVYSISSLREKACGAKSGWLYSVNGTFPSDSCGKCTLKDGDVVRFQYTCDDGKDL